MRVIGGDELEGAVEPLVLLAPACAALFAQLLHRLRATWPRAVPAAISSFNVVGLALSVSLGLASRSTTARPRRRV